MPITREKKTDIVKDLTETLKAARMVILADYKGLSVTKAQAFRRAVKKEGGAVQVVKKTLARIALESAGLPTDALTAYKDTLLFVTHATADTALAKAVATAAKDVQELKVVGGVFEQKTLSGADVGVLAKLPTRDEMLGILLRTLQAPVTSFVRVINAPLTGFATVVGKLATK